VSRRPAIGYVTIEQNDLFKVLTNGSVVGIPPTLIAGVYGMNFENMPDHSWHWGYPFGVGVIAVSAILPLIWFRRWRWF
jgi:magnesium transporter